MVYDEFQASRLGEICKNIFDLSSSTTFFNPRTYMQIHTPTEVQGGGGGGGDGFYLKWKAFDILYKMKYILWVVALLGACDVTNNVRHLGFHQEIEIRLKPREMMTFCA